MAGKEYSLKIENIDLAVQPDRTGDAVKDTVRWAIALVQRMERTEAENNKKVYI